MAAASQKKPPAQSFAPNFWDVLKSLPSVPLHWSAFRSLPDPLLRHALHFKQTATEVTARNKQKATLRQLSWQIWDAGKSTITSSGPYMRAVLAAARHMYTCSAPYALNILRDETIAVASGGPTPPPSPAAAGGKKPGDLVYFPESSNAQIATEWRDAFALELQSAYGAYLESVLGCVLLRADPQQLPAAAKKTYAQKVKHTFV